VHFVTMAHQLAWMEHPAIWLCESCAILWLVLRVVRSPLVRTGVLLMLCGLGMNALVTDTNAGSMPVVGMPSRVRPASPMWQGATFQTRMPLLADQAQLGLFSIGDIALLGGGILIVAICMRQTLERAGRRMARKRTTQSLSAFRISRHPTDNETDCCSNQEYTDNHDLGGLNFSLESASFKLLLPS
jgi:hypothetical protein